MNIVLEPVEARILAVLIEKEISTPDYYPMTLKALVNACNQKTNRNPVMTLEETDVENALSSLREQRLAWQVKTHGSRALKYEHNFRNIDDFSKREMGILCELMLQGPQTSGELRTHTARLYEFDDISIVDLTLQKLISRGKGPYVIQLPRRPGQKESRFAHLFFEVDLTEEAGEDEAVKGPVSPRGGRLDALEQKVSDLEAELKDLKTQFLELKKELE